MDRKLEERITILEDVEEIKKLKSKYAYDLGGLWSFWEI